MRNQILIAGILLLLYSCSSSRQISDRKKPAFLDNDTFLITEISADREYGTTKRKAVRVGGVNSSEGPLNERRYLNALTGPNGEKISYYRNGSCCPVKSKNAAMGMAMLDIYEVTGTDPETPFCSI